MEPNAVGRLQEWTQRKKMPMPEYKEITSNDGLFHVDVTISDVDYVGKGEAANKAAAKQKAAKDLILYIKSISTAKSASGSGSSSVVCAGPTSRLTTPSPLPAPVTSQNTTPSHPPDDAPHLPNPQSHPPSPQLGPFNPPARPSAPPIYRASTPVPQPATSTPLSSSSPLNYVNRVQEWFQGRRLPFPVYREIRTDDGRNPFGYVLSVPSMDGLEGRGVGRTKKDAKRDAARSLYDALMDPRDAEVRCLTSASRSSISASSSSASSSRRGEVDNAIGKLQERAQSRGAPPPEYVWAPPDAASALPFPFVCTVKAFGASAQGGGGNKKEAKQSAAQELLFMLGGNVVGVGAVGEGAGGGAGVKAAGAGAGGGAVTAEEGGATGASAAAASSAAAVVTSASTAAAPPRTSATASAMSTLTDAATAAASSAGYLSSFASTSTSPSAKATVDDAARVASFDSRALSDSNSECSFKSLPIDRSVIGAGSSPSYSAGAAAVVDDSINYVGKLQEEAVRRCIGYPRYEDPATGSTTADGFRVEVALPAVGLAASGVGKRKKEAKNAAAKALLSMVTAPPKSEDSSTESSRDVLPEQHPRERPRRHEGRLGEDDSRSSLERRTAAPLEGAKSSSGAAFPARAVGESKKPLADSARKVARSGGDGAGDGNDAGIEFDLADSAAGNHRTANHAANRATSIPAANSYPAANPNPAPFVDDDDDAVNYVGKLKEYLEGRRLPPAIYVDDPTTGGGGGVVVAVVIIDGEKKIGRGDGGVGGVVLKRKAMKQAASKHLLLQLRRPDSSDAPRSPIRTPAPSPIGLVVGPSPDDGESTLPDDDDGAADEAALASVSLMDFSAGDFVDSAVELVANAEDELDDLVEMIGLPSPEIKITRMKTSGGGAAATAVTREKTLYNCIVTIAGEVEKSGSGASRDEASRNAAHNMLLHLKYRHKDELKRKRKGLEEDDGRRAGGGAGGGGGDDGNRGGATEKVDTRTSIDDSALGLSSADGKENVAVKLMTSSSAPDSNVRKAEAESEAETILSESDFQTELSCGNSFVSPLTSSPARIAPASKTPFPGNSVSASECTGNAPWASASIPAITTTTTVNTRTSPLAPSSLASGDGGGGGGVVSSSPARTGVVGLRSGGEPRLIRTRSSSVATTAVNATASSKLSSRTSSFSHVGDKTRLMTLAQKRPEEAGGPEEAERVGRRRTISEPGSATRDPEIVARIFFNVDESGMGSSYASFKETVENLEMEDRLSTDRSSKDSFFDVDDVSAETTEFRRRLLKSAGVRVVVEPVVRERATSAKEIVRGRTAAAKTLCFLKLDFDPNYEEVEEFQWNRKRRFDRLLVFGGRGVDDEAAEANAFVNAIKHLKAMIAQRRGSEG